MALIFVTGTGGLDRDGLARELEGALPEQLQLVQVGSRLYERTEAQAGRILTRFGEEISAERRALFREIAREARDVEHTVILSHAVFRWPRTVFGWEREELEGLEIDSVCVLVDDIDAVKFRILESGEYGGENFSLKDVAEWRNQEITLTYELAKSLGLKKRFFIVPRRDAAEILTKLLTRPRLVRIYISFPISHVLGDPETMEEIDAYKARLRDVSIGFDPFALQEKRLEKELEVALEEDPERDSFEIECLNGRLDLGVEEVRSVLPEIDRQIVDRDFRLIDQSHEIVAFVPEVGGRPEISAGVVSELWYAFYHGKKSSVVWQPEHRPSPFLAYVADRTFASIEECLQAYEAGDSERREL